MSGFYRTAVRLASLWGFAAVVCGAVSAADKPNLIVILADDMGFSDLGCYGGEIETPHLDALAAGGLRFTQFHNSARCCPTRAALLTGLYPHQAGIGHMVGNDGIPSYQGYLNDRCLTLAEAVKGAGYTTLAVGKWHVGSAPGQWPLDRGFDRFWGTPTGGGVYFKDTLQIRKEVFFVSGQERIEPPDDLYVTDTFTDRALEFLDQAVRQGDRPFFLYFGHIAPHWPLQAKPADIDKYRGRYEIGWDAVRQRRFARQQQLGIVSPDTALSPRDPQARAWSEMPAESRRELAYRMAVYAAQIDCIDQNAGRLVAKLKELNQFDNTLILFLSDNGCSAEGGPGGFSRGHPGAPIGTGLSYASAGLEWANACDTPFRKFKMDTYQGGIATPLVAHWPAGIAARGELRHDPGHIIDVMPTLVELAGATYPAEFRGNSILPREGRSLVPIFAASDGLASTRVLCWEHQGNKAVRSGDWKAVAQGRGAWELFDLKTDRVETRNIAAQHPEKTRELAGLWQAWAARCGVWEWDDLQQHRRNRTKTKSKEKERQVNANGDREALPALRPGQ